jgi:hypothetical protein
MAFMHFYCASHQREIDGGFDLDLDALRRMRREPVHVYCPLCSRMHRYLLADAIEATSVRLELQAEAAMRIDGYDFSFAKAYDTRSRATR